MIRWPNRERDAPSSSIHDGTESLYPSSPLLLCGHLKNRHLVSEQFGDILKLVKPPLLQKCEVADSNPPLPLCLRNEQRSVFCSAAASTLPKKPQKQAASVRHSPLMSKSALQFALQTDAMLIIISDNALEREIERLL